MLFISFQPQCVNVYIGFFNVFAFLSLKSSRNIKWTTMTLNSDTFIFISLQVFAGIVIAFCHNLQKLGDVNNIVINILSPTELSMFQ